MVYQLEEFYIQILCYDYMKYIKLNQMILIDVIIKDFKMWDQCFVVMKIKDVVVDQFCEKFGECFNVDNENLILCLYVCVVKN